jgi:mannose-1-phosphate guanylyltransferase
MLDVIAGRRRAVAPPAVAPDAALDQGVALEAAIVMAGVTVGADAKLRHCAVLPGARIGAGAEVDDSIVGPGVTIGAGARILGGSVLGAGVAIEAGAVIDGQRIPAPEDEGSS